MRATLGSLYVLLTLITTAASNINVASETIKFLQSPLIPSGPNDQHWPPEHTLPENVSASFFGYSLILRKKRIFIGSPKLVHTNQPQNQPNAVGPSEAKGDIFGCLTSSIFSANQKKCRSISPRSSKPGDSFGISFSLGNNSLSACSPTKTQRCAEVDYTPGFCFKRIGRRKWKRDSETTKPICPLKNFDIMFVLDGSKSVGEQNFQLVKNWTKDLASYFNMQSGEAKIGVVQYSHFYKEKKKGKFKYIRTLIKLGQCKTHACFVRSVNKVKLFGFTTYTAHALNKTVDDFRSSDRFNEMSTAKVLILLTDGRSTDEEFLTSSADYVRSLGITTYAIGVGNEVQVDELRIIATGNENSSKRVYEVKDFRGLQAIVKSLKESIFTINLEGDSDQLNSSFGLQMGETGFSSCESTKVNFCWMDLKSEAMSCCDCF